MSRVAYMALLGSAMTSVRSRNWALQFAEPASCSVLPARDMRLTHSIPLQFSKQVQIRVNEPGCLFGLREIGPGSQVAYSNPQTRLGIEGVNELRLQSLTYVIAGGLGVGHGFGAAAVVERVVDVGQPVVAERDLGGQFLEGLEFHAGPPVLDVLPAELPGEAVDGLRPVEVVEILVVAVGDAAVAAGEDIFTGNPDRAGDDRVAPIRLRRRSQKR